MPEFKYTATNPDGVIHSETLIADNLEEIKLMLKKQDLVLINIQQLPDANVSFLDGLLKPVNGEDKAQFLEYFASMLEAGLTVSDSLQAFYEDLDKPMMRKFIKDAQYMIRNGRNLSDAFLAYPNLFPKMYSGVIKVGEASGTLAESLRQLADQLKKTNELKSKVRNAMIYPAIILTALGSMMIGMVVFVIPRLTQFFADANLELPLPTRVLMGASGLIVNYWPIIIGVVVLSVLLFRNGMKDPSFRKGVSRFMLSVPIFGRINKSTNVALFCRTFGSLLSSGVNILEAIDVVQQSLTNQIYVEILDTIRDDVTKGNNISDSMKKFPKYFAPFEIRVLSISERTGEVAQGLKNIAVYYESKLYSLLGGLSSALEPVLLIFMGGMVALMAISVITPIFQLLTGVDQIK